MMDKNNLMSALVKECHRIEEDCLYSMKGHFNASSRWSKVHLFLGLPSAILACWAGLEAFQNNPSFTAMLALLSGALTATITFLSPQKVADSHTNSGRKYNALRNRARRLREVESLVKEPEAFKALVDELADNKDSLNSMSLNIPRWAYDNAKKDIDEGRAQYQIDKEINNDGK